MQRPPADPLSQHQIFPTDIMFRQQQPAPNMLPTPTSNWSMESMPWKIRKTDQSGDVMEFTAHSRKDLMNRTALLHQKRKPDPVLPPFPVKQFISEEKITAHFNGLHISSDYIQHNAGNSSDAPSTTGKCFSNLSYEDYQITAKELEKKLLNANRITICDELKKMHEEQKKVSYFPEALLNRIEKPCTALVLWQPPPPIINMFKHNAFTNANESTTPYNDFNNDDSLIPDVDLPPEREEDDDIDDFVDNNNTCSLDFNNIKPDSMDQDM
ncbi:mst85C [Haematobia irritans]|uniref:mst85C n=1 Tax=Haematobia irritans TaxID=7368 RepID=UPI003F5083A6